MKSSRISLAFGGGYDTIIYSVKKNRFFSYEQERTEIHQIYGGKQYYESRSGLSGAGYLEIDSVQNDIILFGYYRTDAGSGQEKMTVHTIIAKNQRVFGYAPIISHEGIDHSAPFVLTDGEKVAFVSDCDVRDNLLGWEEIKGKEITLTYYDRYGNNRKLAFQLYNPNHFVGVRATRFVDLRSPREEAKAVQLEELESVFARQLSISKEMKDERWYHINVDGILDMKWDEDPRNIKGEIVAGWYGAGDGLYWRRGRNGVAAFMEIKRADLNGGKYVVEGETSEFIDYEQNFSVLEWFSKEVDVWKGHFVTQVTKKARQDYIYAKERSGIDTRQLMEQNTEIRICVQDSLDVGNCEVATRDFVERYNIKLDEDGYTTIKTLLENPSIDEMLRNFNFGKVIHYKLVD